MSKILSKRGCEKLTYGGHLFTFDKNSADGTKKFWRCDKRIIDGCKSRLHTNAITNEVLRLINEHTDGSNAAGVEIAKMQTNLKCSAEDSQEIPSVLFNNILQGTSIAVRGQMPGKDAVRLMVQRKRNEILASPAQPVNLASIIIPDSFRMYEFAPRQNENFLLIDSGAGDPDRILVFGRQSHVNWSFQMKKIYVDGTFRSAPSLFSQVYVIMAARGEFVLPILYALLPDKQEETYKRLFKSIRELWPDFAPSSISTDFEKAALNAMRSIFPESELFGCLFHLVKNMRKKLASEGLMHIYNADPDFGLAARMIVALAFLPPNLLEDALEELTNETPEALMPILNWFEDFYIGRLNRRGIRQPAMFPWKIWSVYERTLNGIDRTNNHAEAAHRRMQAELGMDHPTLWKFINGIQKVQSGRDQSYEQFVRGEEPQKKRLKYQRADERILKIIQNAENRTTIEYLRGIAHNFLKQ